jgi:hypothetical protein
MANFAVLDQDNNVSNIIVAESREIAEDVTKMVCIPCDNTEFLGSHWNGSAFVKPEPAPAE